MSKQKENTLLGLKILSSALLLQQAAANAPALAHEHQGRHFNSAENAGRQRNGNNRLRGFNHFGVQERLNQQSQQQAITAATIDLDLNSTVRSIVIDPGMFRRDPVVTIQQGDSTRTIQAGDSVSAAEFVSFQQAQTGRGQTLNVNSDGTASSGTFSLGALTSGRQSFNVDDVVIPQSVQSIDRAGSRTDIDITGNLINFGTIAERGRQGIVNLSANDIINHSSGVITTLGARNDSIDLNLDASGNFSNEGTISSSGSLAITSGGGLKNIAGALSAKHSVSLQSANIQNSGQVSAETGSINISAPSVNDSSQFLSVNNTGGTLAALNGDISIRESNYTGTANTLVKGGDLLSQKLLLNSGGGTIDVDVNELTGEIVSSGAAVHVNASTDVLTIGTQKLDGDPTFFNTTGSINITGNVFVSEALAIVAAKDITITGPIISTIRAQNAGQGFNILMVAGANVTGTAGQETSTIPGTQAANPISFTGVGLGGNIDFSSATDVNIESNSTGAGLSGANITLAAYSTSASNGKVLFPLAASLLAAGPAGNGNITVIAGCPSGTAISLAQVTDTGNPAAHNLTVINSQPILSSGTQMTINAVGQITSGNALIGDQSNILSGDIAMQVNVVSGSVLVAGNNVSNLLISTPASAAIFSKGNITTRDITAPGGITLVSGRNITSDSPFDLKTNATGNGGDVTIVAGAQYTLSGGSATITGASATGGRVNFLTQPVNQINTSSTTGKGGSVALLAFAGSDNTGDVTLPASSTIVTTSTTFPASGTVTVVAGKTSGTAISLGDITTDINGGFSTVTLQTSDPNVVNPIVVNSSGTITAGFPAVITPLSNANIAVDDITAIGGTVTIASGNNIVVGDIVEFSGQTTMPGGSVIIQTANAALNVGGTPTSNFIQSIDMRPGSNFGNLGILQILNNGDITIAAGAINNQPGNNTGSGTFTLDAGTGDITLPSDTLDFSGTGTNRFGGSITLGANDIIHPGPGPLVLSVNASPLGTASPGSITVELRGGQPTVGLDNTDFTLNATGGGGFSGGNINFKVASNQVLVLDSAAINVNRSFGDGASITLEAGNFQLADPSQNLHLDTGSSFSGGGGSLTLRQTGSGSLVIGNGVGQISLDAGGDGFGGNITVASNGNLTVDSNAINVKASNANGGSGDVSFEAGTGGAGDLLVIGNLDVSGNGTGTAGDVTLISNTATTFSLGAKKGTNGLLGQIINTGGFSVLRVENKGGGLLVSPDLLGFNSIFLTAGVGNVALSKLVGDTNTQNLSITGSGNITSKKGMTANAITLLAGGSIGGKKALKITTDDVAVNAGGPVNLLNSKSTLLSVQNSSATGDFKLTTAGDIVVNSNITATNVNLASTNANTTITLNSGTNIFANTSTGVASLSAGGKKGSGTIVSDGLIQGFAVELNAGTGSIGSLGNRVEIDTQNLVAIAGSGGVFLDSVGTADLNINDAQSAGTFNLLADSKVNINTDFGSTNNLSINATDDINLNSNVGSTKTGGQVALFSIGSITQSSSKFKMSTAGALISLAADGDIGVSGATIRIDGAGSITAINSIGTGQIAIDSLSKNPVTFSAGSQGAVTFTSAGSTALNTTTGKSIFITNAGGKLEVLANQILSTNEGGITLQNLGSGKGSSIFMADNSRLFSNASAPGGGVIGLIIGTVPPPFVVGTAPVGLNVTGGGGTVFFNNGITVNNANNTVNIKNTDVVFSAGKAGPTAIVLDGNVLIDADPPLPAPVSTLASLATVRGGRQQLAAMLSAGNPPSVDNVQSSGENAHSSGTHVQQLATENSIHNLSLLNSLDYRTADQNMLSNQLSSDSIGILATLPAISANKSLLGWSRTQPGWMSETELASGEIPASFEIFDSVEVSAELSKGSMLIAPTKDVSINTAYGDVQIAAKSLVLLMAFPNGVAVYNFDDASRNSVSITSGAHKLALAPGQSAVVTHQSIDSLAEINPAQAIAHRSVNERRFGNGLKAFHSEFSLPSALAAVLPIKELMKSKHPHAVRTSQHLLKTTSILLQLQSGGASFKLHVKPQRVCLTAQAN